MNLEPIFIHSSFRTSSTWFWNEFRICNGVMGFCEIFHEALATMKPEEVALHHPGAWRSNHPAGVAPYFAEFAPLMRPEGGVEGYDPAMAFDRFIPTDGLDGDIGADEAAYVERLINLAAAAGKRAAPSCTRMLGRVAGLKRRFGGAHIFLHRNLFQQWLSYCSLLENHNPYFANTLFYTLDRNRQDPFVAAVLESVNLQGIAPGAGIGEGELVCDEDAFAAFVALHLYLSAHAARTADVTVDANALARHPGYRRERQEQIAAVTGLSVDLSGARESVEYAEFFVSNPAALRDRLENLTRPILAGDDDGAAFARQMLDDTLDELARHQLHSRAVRRLLAAARQERDEWRAATERVDAHAAAQKSHLEALLTRVDELQGDIDKRTAHSAALIGRIDALQGHIDSLQNHIQAQTAEKDLLSEQIAQLLRHAEAQQAHIAVLLPRVDQLQARIDELESEKAELQTRHDHLTAEHAAVSAERNAMLESTSWKVTAPIRWLRDPGGRGGAED